MIRTISLLLAGVLVVPACTWAENAPSASSQAATNVTSPAAAAPSDPTALMAQAALLNGLAGLLVAWHLEATYQTFDADGKPKDQGTFGEWWAGKDRYKTVYTSGGGNLNLTIYRYGKTSASTGSPGWIPFRAQMAQRYLVSPVPTPSAVEKLAFSIVPMNLGQVTLQCLRSPLSEPDAGSYSPYDDLPAVCTTKASPIVRAIVDPNKFLVLYNKIVQIGGRYVAEDLSVRDTDSTIVNMQVTNLELLSTVNDSDFVPPATASSFPAPVAPREIARQKIGGDAPIYPAVAKSQHVQGVVTLDAVITKEGRIGELEVLGGPRTLQRAAYDAVKTWKFKPYLVDGQPEEVQTQIGVMFLHIR